MMVHLSRIAASAAFVLLSIATAEAEMRLEPHDGGVRVFHNDKLFTDYRIDMGPKPILWPIHNRKGVALTRPVPENSAAAKGLDHPHQKSMWFAHGDVNGIDFWSEGPTCGTIRHREFKTLESNEYGATIVTVNDWIGADGKKICEDERKLKIWPSRDGYTINLAIRIKATEGPVTFGDTKEGTLGLRVADWMLPKNGGRILTSGGFEDDAAWGKEATWVDYRGEYEGKLHGITIINHPSSFRYPTYWHVRGYGLFAANPFGVKAFTGEGDGSHTIQKGDEILFAYRLVFYTNQYPLQQLVKDEYGYGQTEP